MSRPLYRYLFAPTVPAEDIQASLVLAAFATESLHRNPRVHPDLLSTFDPQARSCVIDAGSPEGRSLHLLFSTFLLRELDQHLFRVEQVESPRGEPPMPPPPSWSRKNNELRLVDSLDFLRREPAEYYHAMSRDHLSSHLLADFRDNPLLFRRKQLGLVVDEDRPAFVVGRAAHTLILEGRDAYRRGYAFGGPTDPRTGKQFDTRSKPYKDWAARQAKPVLTDWQALLVEQMAGAVWDHPVAQELLTEGLPEGVVRCEYKGVPCQARLDWFNPARGLVDLKTCDRLDQLEADARAFGYLHQLAFYRALIRLGAGVAVPAYLIAVEKRDPFRCGVWLVEPGVLDQAQEENERALNHLLACRREDYWPTGYETLRHFETL